jgi:hypothetical protein
MRPGLPAKPWEAAADWPARKQSRFACARPVDYSVVKDPRRGERPIHRGAAGADNCPFMGLGSFGISKETDHEVCPRGRDRRIPVKRGTP